MRTRHAAATVAALTAGLTASVALRHRASRRLSASAPAPVARPEAARRNGSSSEVARPVATPPAAVREGVVLQFVRPVASSASPLPAAAASPARCGDAGGRTKTGAPCAARASASGRCRHHQIAA